MRNAADKVDMISHPIDSTVFDTEWHNPSFPPCFKGWILKIKSRKLRMKKIDATFAKEFGFELEDHGTWFALYTTSDPIIKGDVINGKARNVVLSYETLPNFFNSFSPDIAMAYADRLTFTAHSACENHGRVTYRNA